MVTAWFRFIRNKNSWKMIRPQNNKCQSRSIHAWYSNLSTYIYVPCIHLSQMYPNVQVNIRPKRMRCPQPRGNIQWEAKICGKHGEVARLSCRNPENPPTLNAKPCVGDTCVLWVNIYYTWMIWRLKFESSEFKRRVFLIDINCFLRPMTHPSNTSGS